MDGDDGAVYKNDPATEYNAITTFVGIEKSIASNISDVAGLEYVIDVTLYNDLVFVLLALYQQLIPFSLLMPPVCGTIGS